MQRIESTDETNVKMYCNTAVQFYTQEKAYTPGQVGPTKKWSKFISQIGDDSIDVFWADWRGSFGQQQIQAMSMGVYDLCTVRMNYHPELYKLLRTKEVLLIKDAASDAVDTDGQPVRNHPDVYKLWGAVDDIRSMRRIMEFKVRRWEAK